MGWFLLSVGLIVSVWIGDVKASSDFEINADDRTLSRQTRAIALPKNLVIEEVTSTSFQARWKPPRGRGINEIRIQITDENGHFSQEATLHRDVDHLLFTDLIPDTVYLVQLRSVKRGRNSKSVSARQRTLPAGESNGEDGYAPQGGGGVLRDCQKVDKTDLVILLDGSWSVGPINYVKVQAFLVDLVQEFKIGFEGVLIGIAQYSDDARTEFNLNAHPTRDSLVEAISNMPYKGGNTATGQAIDYIRENLFTAEAGARKDVHKNAIVITDGESILDDVTAPSDRLKAAGVEVFSIGVAAALESELRTIASEPVEHHVMSVESFDDILEIKKQLLRDVCKPVVLCPKLSPPEYGEMTCTEEVNMVPNTQCTFTCNLPLYKLNEPGDTVTRTCLKGARWDREEPTCVANTCPVLSVPSHGSFTCTSSYTVGSVCSLVCNSGYRVSGSDVITCGTDNTWSAEDMRCVEVTCDELGPLENGDVACSPDLVTYESNCVFSCNEGFQLVGSESSSCLATGYWSHVMPMCSRITCPEPSRFEHGSVGCSDLSNYGSRCEYVCDYGWSLQGSSYRTCTESGWSFQYEAEFPVCIRVRCEVGTVDAHATQACTDDNFHGSLCSFNCDVGYTLMGHASSECGGGTLGVWSWEFPTCQLVTCSALESIENGEIECTDQTNYLSQCALRCNRGYELTGESTVGGSSSITCRADGSWSAALIICIRRRCVQVEKVENGRVVCTDGVNFESKCTTICDEGYQLTSGSRIRACRADRSFSGSVAVCTIKQCPVAVAPLNGAVRCTDGSKYQSTCYFTCNVGYELDSTTPRTCSDDTHWTSAQPSCLIIRCGLLNVPEFGSGSCSNDDIFSSICQFTCNRGYKLLGSSERSCLQTKLWSGELTRCELITCEEITAPANGEITCVGGKVPPSDADNVYSFDTTCTLTCEEGFRVVGSRERRCQQSSFWSGIVASCQKITCPVMREPNHGSVSCSNKNDYASICATTCDTGYLVLSGDTERSCQATALWTGTDVTCQVMTCPGLVARAHTTMTCTNGNRFGSICSFKAELGYRLRGSQVIECDALGGGDPPYAERIVCLQLNELVDGTISCTDGTFFASTCTFECEAGFELIGNLARTCQENMKWTGAQAICQRITCPRLSSPIPGTVACDNDFNYQSTCIFSCPEGWNMAGSEDRMCLATRSWSGETASCIQVTCPELSSPSHGHKQCADLRQANVYGSECEFVCDVGYTMLGSAVRTCSSSGSWSGSEVRCTILTCPSVQAPANGKVRCSDDFNFESTCKFTCNIGFELIGDVTRTCSESAVWTGVNVVCQKIQCATMATPENGFVTCSDSNNYDSECSFRCESGFQLSGSTTRTCQLDASWSEPPTKCTRIRCSALSVPDHGTALCSENDILGSVCRFSCNEGYSLFGTIERTCGNDRSWSGVKVSCIRITCPQLLAPGHGSKTCDANNDYGSVCTFSCDVGFTRVGEATRECGEDGAWSGVSAACHIVQCSALPVPANGKARCSDGVNYESQCRFTCDIGYELIGSKRRTCLETGDWSGSATSCSLITCESLVAPGNGAVACTDANIHDSECHFSCQEGYTLSGSSNRICQLDKTWSGVAAVCTLVVCPAITAPPNGEILCSDDANYASTCGFKCSVGYDLVGSLQRTCRSTGAWSGAEVACDVIRCGELPAPTYGVVTCSADDLYDSVCQLGCNEGYVISGSESRRCEESQTWSGKQTVCTIVNCPALPPPENGRKLCTNKNVFQSTCHFSCDIGYTLVGSGERTCNSDAVWSGTASSCEIVACKPLLPPQHGTINCAGGSSASYGARCRFRCDIGYELSGSVIRSCLEDGSWNGRAASCALIRCGEVGALESGTVECTDGDNFESLCRYSCAAGYQLTGALSRTCREDKSWSGEAPICTKIKCGTLVALQHGTVLCSDGRNYRSECSFECDTRYALLGSSSIACTSSREWSGREPTCQAQTCSPTITVASGSFSCTDGTYVGSECQFSCQVGYELVGSDIRRCETDLAWSGEVASCRLIQCDEIVAPENGDVTCTKGRILGSNCVQSCDDGYVLEGQVSRLCRSNQQWDNPRAVCRLIHCGELDAPQNGQITCSLRDAHASVCAVTCDPGYTIHGSRSRICLDTQNWSGTAATCSVVSCGELDAPLHGSISCTSEDRYGSVCVMTCNDGFHTIGSVTSRTCQSNGEWDNSSPTCSLIKCGKLFNPANGQVACSDANNFNSVCRISCFEGYELIGSQVRVCEDSGQFSGSEGVCQITSCVTLDELANGEVRCAAGSLYNSVCSYTCDLGYILVGSSSQRCLSSADWSNSQPVCERVACRRLQTPWNGDLTCTEGFLSGSACSISCTGCSHLVGSAVRNCRNDGTWSGEIAYCEASHCPSLRKPRNGYIRCEDGVNECGVSCTFSCRSGYELKGDGTRTCQDNLDWSGVEATCVSTQCQRLRVDEFGGTVNCTDGNNVGSICTFVCTGEGVLIGSASSTCQLNGRWSNTAPVCQTCKAAVSDVFFLIDGSWSVGHRNFVKVKHFLKSLAEPFEVGWDKSRFSLVQYSDDPRLEFPLKKYLTTTEVLNAIEAIPYKGGNTNTGRALSFSLYNALSPENGARAYVNKVALILTDGRSQDEVDNPAHLLRQSGVKVLAIGVGDADESELRKIASPPYESNIFRVENFDAIEDVQAVLSARLCESTGSERRPNDLCGCPAGPPGPAGTPGRDGRPGDSIKGQKGDAFSVIHVNYDEQSITARNGDGEVVELPIPAGLRVDRDDTSTRAFFPVPGPPGPPGPTGSVGPMGPAGQPGPTGPKGENGAEGADGQDGINGLPGPKGSPGKKGERGKTGSITRDQKLEIMKRSEDAAKQMSQSEVRAMMDKMSPGSMTTRSRVERVAVRGPPGPPGLPGPRGDRGQPGMEGVQGAQGLQGLPGVKGSRGFKGEAGDIGPRGLPGIGSPGPKGPPGPRGHRGKPGRKRSARHTSMSEHS